MPTGNEKTNFADKRVLPQQSLKDGFFDYLAEEFLEVAKRVWAGKRGTFGAVSLTGGTDKVSVSGLPVECLDGDGRILEVDGSDGTDLAFENALGVTYYLGARHVEVPSGVVRNPRVPGVVDYDVLVDAVGEKAAPDSVAEGVGVLDLVVDAVFEAGVDHSGRLATVYLLTPKTTVEATAIERNLVVTWDGSNNKVQTAGLLGQSSGSASTTPADYVVVAQGVTIRRNTDLSATSPYAFLGTATGAGAGGTPTVSTAGQVNVQSGINESLDDVYGNSGSQTKTTAVDDGALEYVTATSTGDKEGAQLRLVRFGNTGQAQFMLVLETGGERSIPIAVLEKAAKAAAGVNEDNSGTVTLGRIVNLAGADMLDDDLRLSETFCMILITSGVEAERGLYFIEDGTLQADSFEMIDLDGNSVSGLTNEAKTFSILQPQFVVAGSDINPGGGATLADLAGTTLFCAGGKQDDRPLKIFSHGCTGAAVEIFDNALISEIGENQKRRLAAVLPDQVGVNDSAVFEFLRTVLIDAGETGGAGQPADYRREALKLLRGGAFYNFGNTIFPHLGLSVWENEVLPSISLPLPCGFKGGLTEEGQLVRGHFFEDHFFYHPNAWTAYNAGIPSQYYCIVSSGDVKAVHGSAARGCGSAEITSGTANGNNATLYGPYAAQVPQSKGFQWRFSALLRTDEITDVILEVGLEDVLGALPAKFRFESGVNGNRWQFVYDDASGATQTVDTAVLNLADEWWTFDLWEVGEETWKWRLARQGVTSWAAGEVQIGTTGTYFGNAVGSVWAPFAKVETKGTPATDRKMNLDYWQLQDVGNPIYGRIFNTAE